MLKQVLEVLDLLDNLNKPVSYFEFLSMCAERSIFGALRQMGGLIYTLIDEHNAVWA